MTGKHQEITMPLIKSQSPVGVLEAGTAILDQVFFLERSIMTCLKKISPRQFNRLNSLLMTGWLSQRLTELVQAPG